MFKQILADIRVPLDFALNYSIKSFASKIRRYHYYDTFDGSLIERDILTYVGPLELEGASASLRAREKDYVLTVKIPTSNSLERKEYQCVIPSDLDFYRLDPNAIDFWKPLRIVKEHGRNMPLQEIIRLNVETNRFDLYQSDEPVVEIAADKVSVQGPFNIQKTFYELEVEAKDGRQHLDVIASFLAGKYQLQESALPKWIKALKLIRGEELVPSCL